MFISYSDENNNNYCTTIYDYNRFIEKYENNDYDTLKSVNNVTMGIMGYIATYNSLEDVYKICLTVKESLNNNPDCNPFEEKIKNSEDKLNYDDYFNQSAFNIKKRIEEAKNTYNVLDDIQEFYRKHTIKEVYEFIKDISDEDLCAEWEPVLYKVKFRNRLTLFESAIFLLIKNRHPEWVKSIIDDEVKKLIKGVAVFIIAILVIIGFSFIS